MKVDSVGGVIVVVVACFVTQLDATHLVEKHIWPSFVCAQNVNQSLMAFLGQLIRLPGVDCGSTRWKGGWSVQRSLQLKCKIYAWESSKTNEQQPEWGKAGKGAK